jgi:hypothetical protein
MNSQRDCAWHSGIEARVTNAEKVDTEQWLAINELRKAVNALLWRVALIVGMITGGATMIDKLLK